MPVCLSVCLCAWKGAWLNCRAAQHGGKQQRIWGFWRWGTQWQLAAGDVRKNTGRLRWRRPLHRLVLINSMGSLHSPFVEQGRRADVSVDMFSLTQFLTKAHFSPVSHAERKQCILSSAGRSSPWWLWRWARYVTPYSVVEVYQCNMLTSSSG